MQLVYSRINVMLWAERLAIAILLLLIWQTSVWLFEIPAFILPGPGVVFATIFTESAMLLRHGSITALEIVVGLAAGCLLGAATAVGMHLFPIFRRFTYPVVVVSQTLPVFAIAPLLMIWFGFGLGSKIAMTILIIYFPICTALYFGMRNTQSQLLDLALLSGASRWQTLSHFELPSALPAFATGLRVSATMAPIGAVVGEWVGSSAGLGFVMLNANARMQTSTTFAALVVLAALALIIRAFADHISHRLTRWV
jgi:putative hydroxymethylpyrimidine transport system permease protein